MKKLYTTPSYRLRQKRLITLRAKEAWRHNYTKSLTNLRKQTQKASTIISHEGTHPVPIVLTAPAVLNLLANTAQVVNFFHEIIETHVEKSQYLFLDMKHVTEITYDCILYLCCLLDLCHARRIPLGGSYPDKSDCKARLLNSAFPRHLKSGRTKEHVETENQITVWGNKTSPQKSKQIVKFIIKKRGIPTSLAKKIHPILIECMANAFNHAYTNDEKRKWWLSAHYNSTSENVEVVFLDNGPGIPATIQQKFVEKIATLFNRSGSILGVNDCSLIESAMHGDFRTRTEKRERGLGLPLIYKHINNSVLKKFHLISGQAGFHPDPYPLSKQFLPVKFRGTMISWTI